MHRCLATMIAAILLSGAMMTNSQPESSGPIKVGNNDAQTSDSNFANEESVSRPTSLEEHAVNSKPSDAKDMAAEGALQSGKTEVAGKIRTSR